MARSTARKRALNTLYEADEKSRIFSPCLTSASHIPVPRPRFPTMPLKSSRAWPSTVVRST